MSERASLRMAQANGTTSQSTSDAATAAPAAVIPPVNRRSAAVAAPNADVPSMASNAPVRAASTGLTRVAQMCSR